MADIPGYCFAVTCRGRQTVGSLMRQIPEVDAICFAEEQAV